jgi:hypothetical protein
MLVTQNNNAASALDNSPELGNGNTRDIIAEKVQFGSGRTYERAL